MLSLLVKYPVYKSFVMCKNCKNSPTSISVFKNVASIAVGKDKEMEGGRKETGGNECPVFPRIYVGNPIAYSTVAPFLYFFLWSFIRKTNINAIQFYVIGVVVSFSLMSP